MKTAFFVNDLATEQPNYTTTRLAMAMNARGHEVWYITPRDFAYDPDNRIHAHAVAPPRDESFDTPEVFLEHLQGEDARKERVTIDGFDVLMLRNDPSVDVVERPWASNIGVIFGQIATRHGVLVVNDPFGLTRAMNKLYFQQFPSEVYPRTLVTRSADDIKKFVKDEQGLAVLKPLQGSGGKNVFLVNPENTGNLNQMIEAISRDGYVIAQEYLPSAKEGDTRLFLLNGRPLAHEGKYAAFRRVASEDDIRSNMHVGGKAAPAEIGPEALRLAEALRPKLIQDGMFFVGLDIVGDKLMEVNVFSPGGLYSASQLAGVDFVGVLIDALERKIAFRRLYPGAFSNTELATL
jgi:glutathione synthase